MTDETGMKEIIVEGEFEKEIKTERLYGGFQIRKLRMVNQDDWQLYMVNPKTGRECYQPRPHGDANLMRLADVRDREIKNYKRSGGAEYLSWIIGDKSPFDKRKFRDTKAKLNLGHFRLHDGYKSHMIRKN